MDAFRVGECREQVLDHVDDEDGRRYAPIDDDTGLPKYQKLDRCLRVSASALLDEYVREGGDRFDEDISVSTDTSGIANLAAEKLLHIKSVLVIPDGSDGTLFPISEGDKQTRGLPDETERDLTLIAIRQHVLPDQPAADDLLMGTVDGAARSWPAFDELVCMTAADRICTKSNETRTGILRDIARLRTSVFTHKREPDVLPWGRRARSVGFSSLQDTLHWIWLAREQRLQLLFRGRTV